MIAGFALGYALYQVAFVLSAGLQTPSLQIIGLGLIALWVLHAVLKGSFYPSPTTLGPNESRLEDTPFYSLFLPLGTLPRLKSRQIRKSASVTELSVEIDDVLRTLRSGDTVLTDVRTL